MNPTLSKILYWSPRILGLLIALFTAVFALDVFGQGYTFWQSILAFFIHLLVPTVPLLIGLWLAWRWPLVGTVIFIGWAIYYLAFAWGQFPLDVYLILSGVPALVGLLFLADWFYRRNAPGPDRKNQRPGGRASRRTL